MNDFKTFREEKNQEEKREKRAERILTISSQSSMSEKEILRDIKNINAKGIYKINLALYGKWNLFSLDVQELETILNNFLERRIIKETVSEKWKSIDDGVLSSACLTEDYDKCLQFHKHMVSSDMAEKYRESIKDKGYSIDEDEGLLALIADMETMLFLFGYSYEEYLAFHFMDKPLEERLSFLSGAERKRVLLAINDEDASDVFHDKHQCYIQFEKYFKRKQVCVYNQDDFPAFQQFCKRTKSFVKKPLFSQKGRGIERITLNHHTSLEDNFNRLLDENGPFVVEEVIKTHEALTRLNPDSVNTVRVETFHDYGESKIVTAFLRVGKKGFFVDNGSAGGIIIPIDLGCGRLMSVGCDKTNTTYRNHPDTGVLFEDYQIPKWKQLMKLAQKLADKTPGVKYIGWDFTLDHKGRWVVVEGNARPGGFGNQRSLGIGTRKAFFDAIGVSPNAFR